MTRTRTGRYAPEERTAYTGELFDEDRIAAEQRRADPSEIQRHRNAIAEGEMLLRGKLEPGKRAGIERAVASSRAKLEAEQRRDDGISNAVANADARGDWSDRFLATVRAMAIQRPEFLAEDVLALCPAPFGVNPKATGGFMRRAVSAGYVTPGGVGRANSSNRSFKVAWRSLIYRGALASGGAT